MPAVLDIEATRADRRADDRKAPGHEIQHLEIRAGAREHGVQRHVAAAEKARLRRAAQQSQQSHVLRSVAEPVTHRARDGETKPRQRRSEDLANEACSLDVRRVAAAEKYRQRARVARRPRVDLAVRGALVRRRLVGRGLEAIGRHRQLARIAAVAFHEHLALGVRRREHELARAHQPRFELADQRHVPRLVRPLQHLLHQVGFDVVAVVDARLAVLPQLLVVVDHERRIVEDDVRARHECPIAAVIGSLAFRRQRAHQRGTLLSDALRIEIPMKVDVDALLRNSMLAEAGVEFHDLLALLRERRRQERDVVAPAQVMIDVEISLLASARWRKEGGEEVEDEEPRHALCAITA